MSPNINEATMFITKYLQALQASGAHVSRCERCTRRIAKAFGYDISINFFFNNTALMLTDIERPHNKKTVVLTNPAVGVNLATLRELSALSWEIHDTLPSIGLCCEHLDLAVSRTKSERGNMLSFVICGIAFAALCRLFGGDFGSMVLVFFASFSGAYLRHIFTLKGLDVRLQYFFLSFYSSSFVVLGYKLLGADFTSTLDTSVPTSMLYLIPGVFFINAVIDILDNHILMGISRIIHISILLVCMAVGVFLTLRIFSIGLLS